MMNKIFGHRMIPRKPIYLMGIPGRGERAKQDRNESQNLPKFDEKY